VSRLRATRIGEEMLTISLVTPNFNYGHFVEAALKSVLDQNYRSLQYVVIDGCSNDDSVSIVERYRNQLHFFASEPDRGNYDAINKGFAQTDGEIMGWLNSDDMLFPWCLRAVAEIFDQHPDVEWISSMQPALWDEDGFLMGIATRSGFSKEAFLDGKFLLENVPLPQGFEVGANPAGTIQQESTFWRRSLWDRAGGRVSSDYGDAGDFELWSRFYEHADLVGVDTPLGGFRVHSVQKSADCASYASNAAHALHDARQRIGWRTGQGHPKGMRRAFGMVARANYRGERIGRAKGTDGKLRWIKQGHSFT